MPNPLHNLGEALEALEAKAVRTDQGSYVKIEDVQDLVRKFQESDAIAKAEPIPTRMTPEKARQMVKRDPEIMKHFPPLTPPPGRSVPAGPIASEGVKS